MKNGMHQNASVAPVYHGVAGHVRKEAIAQCDRCHVTSSAELATIDFATGAKVLGFRVYDAVDEVVMQAEANWRGLDHRATEGRDPRLMRQADAARVDLYRLRDAVRGNPQYRHEGCGGVVHVTTTEPGPTRPRVYQRSLLS